MQIANINYKGLIDYLSSNQEIPYSNPDDSEVDEDEKNRLLTMKQKGEAAISELEKIAGRCKSLFGLDFCLPGSWLDRSGTKTRKYLQLQMRYQVYADSPINISLFVEKNDKITRFRISLDISDGMYQKTHETSHMRTGLKISYGQVYNCTDKKTMEKFHRHLDLSIGDGLVYTAGSNAWGNPEALHDSQEMIKDKIANKALRKVQLSTYVNPEPGKTNEQYDAEIMDGVRKILPYYEYVIGKNRSERKELEEMDSSNIEYDKNMILYGPPGTGKTYSTAIYAVAICDSLPVETVKAMDYDEVMIRYRELSDEGRIAFTTFHQSYGYEDFIEGIKPKVDEDSEEIAYSVEPGIFKKFCEYARTPAQMKVDPNVQIWLVRLDTDEAHENKAQCYQNGEIRFDSSKERTSENSGFYTRFIDSMQVGDYVISYAGQSVYIDGIGLIEGEPVYDSERENYCWSRKVKWIYQGEKLDVKHINGNRYLSNYEIARIHHMKLSDLLGLLTFADTEEKEPYVFVIDEINRGNISKIFGELITLIEDTKREGMDEETSAILPYSGESFSVPSNVYILGTMNTADRSIAIMDTALRRRFHFIEMMPDANVLREIGADHVEDLDVAAMLEKMNERITYLYDREHTIGHAFFTKLAEQPDIETLRSIFEKSVIPLLQEYFYEDYQKIQLVLGDNGKTDPSAKFILDEEVNVRNVFKGDAEDLVDLPEKKYSINKEAFSNIESYKQIL